MVPWTKEPGRIQSVRLQKVEHGCATNTQINKQMIASCGKYWIILTGRYTVGQEVRWVFSKDTVEKLENFSCEKI